MKRKFSTILFCLLIVHFSCEDILEVQPEDRVDLDVLYESPADAEAGLIGVYYSLFRQLLPDMIYNASLSANELYDAQRGAANRPLNYRPALRVDNDGGVSSSWQIAYQAIQRANLLTEKVGALDPVLFREGSQPGKTRKDEILAEARFVRAYVYYLLAMNWGDVPLLTEFPSSSDPGENNIAKSPRSAVLDQVVQDLAFAEENLPWNHNSIRDFAPDETTGPVLNSKGRATRGAAKMLLAKIHMANQQWNEALARTREIFESGEFQLATSWTSIFYNTGGQNTVESIWEVQSEFQEFNNTGGYFFRVESSGRTSATPEVYNLFEGSPADPRDIRKGFSMSPSASNPQAFITSFKYYNRDGGYSAADPFNFVIFRLGDAQLMLAECLNEIQYGGQEALDLVNAIRGRTAGMFANVTYAGIAPVSYDEYQDQQAFRQLIREERRRELLFEGHAWYDLLRYDSYDGGDRAVQSTSLHLAVDGADPRKVLLPIPDRDIRVNTLLSQNPGY